MRMPRSLLLVVLGVSFLVLMPELWGWPVFDGGPGWLRAGWDRLTWVAALFPHALAFPISATAFGAAGATMVVFGADVAIVAIVLRTQPPRLRLGRFATLMAVWAALSVVATLLGPYLIAATWRA